MVVQRHRKDQRIFLIGRINYFYGASAAQKGLETRARAANPLFLNKIIAYYDL